MMEAVGEPILPSCRMRGKCNFIFKTIDKIVYMPEDPPNRDYSFKNSIMLIN